MNISYFHEELSLLFNGYSTLSFNIHTHSKIQNSLWNYYIITCSTFMKCTSGFLINRVTCLEIINWGKVIQWQQLTSHRRCSFLEQKGKSWYLCPSIRQGFPTCGRQMSRGLRRVGWGFRSFGEVDTLPGTLPKLK